MLQILIPTHLNDIHALAVAHLLRIKGHKPTLWYGADYPTRQRASINVQSQGRANWAVCGPALSLSNMKFDVVWHRRATPAVLPEQMHPGDRKFAERECKEFIAALWKILGPQSFWVNSLEGRERAKSKIWQLLEAGRVGLQVPPTLCSNDPDEIKSFLNTHAPKVIYKAFTPAQWDRGEDGIAILFTSSVNIDTLPEDNILQLSPGIFQPKIEKEYEIRATYMGHHQIAAKLISRKDSANLDWRIEFTQEFAKIDVEPIVLPEKIDHACKRLMNRLGIVFGCFDFIVTPEGDHIFLEVNEMGQFLWIEEMNPSIPMLEPFTEFLISGDPEFKWRKTGKTASFLDYRDEVSAKHSEVDLPLHLPRSNPFAACD